MFDITITDLSYTQFISIHALYIFIVALYWRSYVTNFDYYQTPKPIFIFLIIIYLTFAYDGGDFFHYARIVQQNRYDNIESVYQILIKFVSNNYVLFRLCVWGSAYALFFLTCKRFNIDPYKTSYFLFVMYVLIFDYARASLGMAIYFYGLSFLCNPLHNQKIVSYIIGIIIICLSVYFHRSMYLVIVMTTMIFIPINKKIFFIMIGLFAISSTILNKMFLILVNQDIVGFEGLNEKIAEYSSQEFYEGYSKFEWIRRIFEYATFFIPFGIVTHKFLYSEELVEDDKLIAMKRLYKVTLGLLMLAISTLLVDLETFTLFYRFLYMSMIPICLLFCYAREENLISPSIYKKILLLGIFCKMFGFVKRLGGGSLVE